MPLNTTALPSTLSRNGAFTHAPAPELSHRESNDARDQLLTMRDHFKGKTGRITCRSLRKSGINDHEQLTFTRRGWFNFWRGGVWNTQQKTQTNAYIKTTIENAYKHRLPEQAFKTLQDELSKYLAKNHAGVGSRHFVKFIERFEQSIEMAPLDGESNAPGKAATSSGRVVHSLNKELADQLGQRKVQAVLDENTGESVGGVSGPEALQRNLAGVRALTGDADARPLASGVEATVYGARRNGQDVIIRLTSAKYEVSPTELLSARSGDIAAAKKAAKNPMPHVVTPSSYVIKCTPPNGISKTYEVKPQEIPELMRLVRGQQLEILATVMPRAQGQSLDKFLEGQQQVGLSTANAQKLAVGLALGMEELRKNKLVHHDIKPANVMFDPQGGVKLVDLGGIVRLSQKEQKSEHHQARSRIGSPPLQSPWVAQGQPHSHEADRYSFAMTLLGALEPKLLHSRAGTTEAVKEEEVADEAKEAASLKLNALKRSIRTDAMNLESEKADLETLQTTLNAFAEDRNDPDTMREVAEKKEKIQLQIDQKRERIRRLQADLARNAELENEAERTLLEATRRHDEAKAALTPVVYHKKSPLRFLLNGTGKSIKPNLILQTFMHELKQIDPVAAQTLETKLSANNHQLKKIIEGAFIAAEPGENTHRQWAQVLELCATATPDPQEQAALRQAIEGLTSEANRLKGERVDALQRVLTARNEQSANAALEKMMARVGPAYAIGVAEIVDTLPANDLVAQHDRIFASDSKALTSQDDGQDSREDDSKRESLPKHLLFIPGRERLNKKAIAFENDFQKFAAMPMGKTAVDADFNVAKDDPRIQQFAKDYLGTRAQPLILSNGDDLSKMPIPERWRAFVNDIDRLYPDPLEAAKARTELPQFLNQVIGAELLVPVDSPVAMDMNNMNIEITGRDAQGWLNIKVTGERHGLDTTGGQQAIKLRQDAPAGAYSVIEPHFAETYTTRQEYAIHMRYKPSNPAPAQSLVEHQDGVAVEPTTGSIRVDKMMKGFKVSER